MIIWVSVRAKKMYGRRRKVCVHHGLRRVTVAFWEVEER